MNEQEVIPPQSISRQNNNFSNAPPPASKVFCCDQHAQIHFKSYVVFGGRDEGDIYVSTNCLPTILKVHAF